MTHLSPSQRVLVICHKQLGDVALLEPAIAKLHAAFGGPIDVLTRSGHAPLISLIPHARMASAAWLRRAGAVFCYDGLDKSALRALLTISSRKDLVLRELEDCRPLSRLAFRSVHAPGLGARYVAEYNWACTAVDSGEPFRPPTLRQPPDEWRPPGFDAGDYLLLNPTAGWKRKRWKAKSWQTVLSTFSGPKRILVTSGGQDWQIAHAQEIAGALGSRALFLGGRTRLEEFLWLVANARMVLGVDGAASHLAAAFGVPNLTVFLTTSPANWHFPTERSLAIQASAATSDDERRHQIDAVRAAAESLWHL